MDYVLIGLVLIVIAWILQIVRSMGDKKDIKMRAMFLGPYILGVLLLALDGYMKNAMETAALNLVCAILAAIIVLKKFM